MWPSRPFVGVLGIEYASLCLHGKTSLQTFLGILITTSTCPHLKRKQVTKERCEPPTSKISCLHLQKNLFFYMLFSMLTNSYALDSYKDIGKHSAIQTFFKIYFQFFKQNSPFSSFWKGTIINRLDGWSLKAVSHATTLEACPTKLEL